MSPILAKMLIRTPIARLLPSVKRLPADGGAFLHYYSDRILSTLRADLRQAADLMEARGPDVIDLGSGNPCFDLVASGSTKLPADRRGWPQPWGQPELRQAVADLLATDLRLNLNPAEEVLITHGASGALAAALDAFVNPGDRVVLLDPTSPVFSFFLRYRRARILWVPTWMEAGRTRFQMKSMVKALAHARMIVLAAPNNPTGGFMSAEDLDQIAWWARRRDVLIVNDMVFDRFLYDGRPMTIATMAAARSRTITVGSTSKGHGLAAHRVGWLTGNRHLVAPSAIAAAMQAPFVSNLSQQVALSALRADETAFRALHGEFDSRRHYAFERLESMGLRPAWPLGAFFLWLSVKDLGLDGGEFARRLDQAKKVAVWPGELFGPSGEHHVRLSYAAEDGRLREGLGRMAEFVRELRLRPSEARKAAA